MTEPSRILPVLEPPPGGLERLRTRIAENPPHVPRTVRVLVGLTVFALAVGGSVLLAPRPDSGALLSRATFDPTLVSLGLQRAPSEPAMVLPGSRHEMALLRVPLRNERVVFYRLVTLPAPPEAAEPPDASVPGPDRIGDSAGPP